MNCLLFQDSSGTDLIGSSFSCSINLNSDSFWRILDKLLFNRVASKILLSPSINNLSTYSMSTPMISIPPCSSGLGGTNPENF